MQRYPVLTSDLYTTYNQGYSAAEVAEMYGISTSTVKKRFRDEHLPMRPLTMRTDRWYANIAKRRQQTLPLNEAEMAFYQQFKDRGIEVVPNYAVGRYNIDLAYIQKMLAIELDGNSHQYPKSRAKDKQKTAYLESKGWTVIRVRVDYRMTGKVIVPRLCRKYGLL